MTTRIKIMVALPERRRLDAPTRRERDISAVFDRLFTPAHPFSLAAEGLWHPLTDIHEFEDCFLIRMDLAGVDPRGIEVMKEGRCLVVRGHRPEPALHRAVACHQLEISYGAFERVVCLPVEFSADQVRVEYGLAGFFQITVLKV